MNKKSLWLGISLVIAPLSVAQAAPFGTFDPRSMAMGGTAVAAGTSANAGFFNPALLAIANKDEDFSLEFPILNARIADQDEFIDRLDTFQTNNSIDNFSNAISVFNAAVTPAQVSAAKDSVVSTGNTLMAGLGTLSNRDLEMEIMTGATVGVPGKKFAISVFVAARAMGGMQLDITQNDVGRIQAILDQLAAKIEKSSDTAKAEAKPKLDALRGQAAKLNKKLDEARNATESTWDDVKAGFKKGYAELKDGFNQARQWVSDKIAP